ncbi:MAG TPA: hypothetical protein VFB96_22400, partial [Pirellulaceae bacterium]|nr:hypothetical protein [Pirellulaceae bacterium]
MSASSATPAPTAAPRGWLSLLTGRWHRSSWVVAAVMLLFLVFCNLPGQTVTHVDINGSEWKSIDSPIEHGWPFTWAVRPGYAAYIGIGMPSFNAPNCWEFWNDATVYIWTALAADAFVVVALTLISAGTFELWRRARARVWQLHLRDILIVVLLISLAGGWYTRKQQRHARDLRLTEGDGLTSMPGMPATPNAHGIAWHSDSLGGPTWVRQLFGEKHFQFLDRVVEVGVDRDGLAWLGELTDVRVVSVVGGITSRSLSHLERVPRLEVLNLIEARHEPEYEADIGRFFPHYGDEPPADTTPRLKLPAMPRLRRLTIQDARVEGLAALPALEVLDWRGAPADQPLFEQLAANTRLRKVSLCECTVAWHQLELLGSLPNLEHLELDGTTIDDENVKNLAALTRLR